MEVSSGTIALAAQFKLPVKSCQSANLLSPPDETLASAARNA